LGRCLADGWYHTSDTTWFRGLFHFCLFGGSYSATLDLNNIQCSDGRTVQAVDFATGQRSNLVYPGWR
jgi:hypothetical protein